MKAAALGITLLATTLLFGASPVSAMGQRHEFRGDADAFQNRSFFVERRAGFDADRRFFVERPCCVDRRFFIDRRVFVTRPVVVVPRIIVAPPVASPVVIVPPVVVFP